MRLRERCFARPSEVTAVRLIESVSLRQILLEPLTTVGRALVEEGVAENAIVVPQQGVAHDPKGNAMAMVVSAEGKVEQRALVTERAIGNKWLISDGLKAGDQLIVEGLQKARPGTAVNAVPAGSPATPPKGMPGGGAPAAKP